MFFLLTNKREILDFTNEQLQYIPKILLLQEFENYVEILWDRLPNHLKTNPEVQRCRPCLEHYNRPWQRTHIDGPPPLINGEYELGLTNFETYNAIPNVTSANNKFYFDTDDKIITIPEGSYELSAINRYLRAAIRHVRRRTLNER
ncbi:hypothetical protein ALC57_08563 [Trachymyrmex cornetzi]|uniref:Uncharacterized protein n=1 Tax=Trachymyrmex cornetzi TaxID=471704 RepID=A0A151J6U9_9HYME|nr:hypothetical protein ALC57_08563 [Trachymyrmex cornetzi]